MPILPNTLYAAYVLSSEALAKIVSIDTKEALASPGAVRFIGGKDVPGRNEWSLFPFEIKILFALDSGK
jgi:xanthine dehydrogenase molybdopterin-binding subunit B